MEIEERQIEEMVRKYSNMLYKICIVILCNEQDVQDAIQETFCRLMEKRPVFEGEEHEKAWLIRVATNICKDMLRFKMRHPKISIESIGSIKAVDSTETIDSIDVIGSTQAADPIERLSAYLVAPRYRETLTELFKLPLKLRTVIYLHYVEEYQIKEISDILGITQHAVKKRLQRGREQLRILYKEE